MFYLGYRKCTWQIVRVRLGILNQFNCRPLSALRTGTQETENGSLHVSADSLMAPHSLNASEHMAMNEASLWPILSIDMAFSRR